MDDIKAKVFYMKLSENLTKSSVILVFSSTGESLQFLSIESFYYVPKSKLYCTDLITQIAYFDLDKVKLILEICKTNYPNNIFKIGKVSIFIEEIKNVDVL